MRLFVTIVALALLGAGVCLDAQQTTTELPTGATVLVIPPTGDANTVTPVGQLNTPIGVASPICNQPQVAAGSGSLVNPKFAVFDDPFNVGRTCRVPFPTGLPEGQFRAVVLYTTAAATCEIGGAPRTPCTSDRSVVAIPPFSISNVKLAPNAPTGVLITR